LLSAGVFVAFSRDWADRTPHGGHMARHGILPRGKIQGREWGCQAGGSRQGKNSGHRSGPRQKKRFLATAKANTLIEVRFSARLQGATASGGSLRRWWEVDVFQAVQSDRLAAAFLAAAVALLAWNYGGATPVRAEPPGTIDMAEIARRLTEWRGSFVNVRVVWELRSLPETDEGVIEWPPPPDPETAGLFARNEWIWADHGLDLLENWSFFHDDGSSKVHSIEAFSGPKGLVFRAQFRKPTEEGPEEYLDLVLRGLGTGKPISRIERDPTDALYWPGFAEWLPEILAKWKWEIEEVEDVGGQRCARVADLVEVLWLDLDHDCLVRRHRTRTLAGEWPNRGRDFIVDEFQRLDAGIWFPKRGRSQLAGTRHENHLFLVTEAAVNESVDPARFDPPQPAVGTAVDDHGRTYVHGISGPPAHRGNKMNGTEQADSPAGNPGATARFVSASPPASSWIWWSSALAGVAVIFLAAGFWLSHRK
ncbi:MAG TPA: hypothetical protein PK867_18705, partial [Pirellulales bacterium]|nr:hypothetical protein [Pirellulales bacterium]